MTTIIKIVIALTLLTAVAQAGMVALTNYQFEDAVHEALLFAPRATDAEIVEQVMSLATSYGLAVATENITVRQVGPDLHVDITYDAEVPLLPGIYTRTWTFHPTSSVRMMPGSLTR